MYQRKWGFYKENPIPPQSLDKSPPEHPPNLLDLLIDTNGFPLHLKDIAVQTGIPQSYLSRLLNRLLGMPFGKFCTRTRCLNSLPCLLLTSEPIDNISQRVGFSDASNYSRAFKRTFGYRPSEFRKFFSQNKFGQSFVKYFLSPFIKINLGGGHYYVGCDVIPIVAQGYPSYRFAAKARDKVGNENIYIKSVQFTPAPPTVGLTANPTTHYICVGPFDSTLSWSVSSATDIVIRRSIDNSIVYELHNNPYYQHISGSAPVQDREPTDYVLTATGPGGISTKSVGISLVPPPPPIIQFWADNTMLSNNECYNSHYTTYLHWSVLYAWSVKIPKLNVDDSNLECDPTKNPMVGNRHVGPITQNEIYTLYAYNTYLDARDEFLFYEDTHPGLFAVSLPGPGTDEIQVIFSTYNVDTVEFWAEENILWGTHWTKQSSWSCPDTLGEISRVCKYDAYSGYGKNGRCKVRAGNMRYWKESEVFSVY